MMKLDLLLKNCLVIDGTGNPWYEADIGVDDGRIAQIRRGIKAGAKTLLDLSGLVLCPGFIDPHSHSDRTLFIQRRAASALRQGITTQAIGNCGFSCAPVTDRNRKYLQSRIAQANHLKPEEIKINWRSMRQYLGKLRQGMGTNAVPLVGHGVVRMAVLGPEGKGGQKTKISSKELEHMKELVRGAMNDGARGLSSGLTYAPGRNASTEELIELCNVVREYDGFYFTHCRDEGDVVVEAYREAVRIAREANVSVNIAHHKSWGRPNWGKVRQTLAIIESARREGLDVTCDVYPYPRAGVGSVADRLMSYTQFNDLQDFLKHISDLAEFQKLRRQIERNLDLQRRADEARRRALKAVRVAWPKFNVPGYAVIVYSKTHPEFLDMNLAEIAKAMGKDWITAARQLAIDDEGVTRMAGFMTEEDVRTVIKHPISMIGTDAVSSDEPPKDPLIAMHPRTYGTYPRVLEKYVRKENLLSLPEAIRKMTSLPAHALHLRDRGLIAVGMHADLVAFDQEKVRETGTFANPASYPKGIQHVMVNGVLAVRDETLTGALAGRVL